MTGENILTDSIIVVTSIKISHFTFSIPCIRF